ncbi:hypothetical protein [Nocardia brasiliensis]|uniref:hypothetical protein n=1 Tax=Nocardia brasiliensis TaxID=37326 RepID=UPI0024585339|nr:hypothetical protein [Nocardia brasiliensis]
MISGTEYFAILDRHNVASAFDPAPDGTRWLVPLDGSNPLDALADIAAVAGMTVAEALAGSAAGLYGEGSISIPAVRVNAGRSGF